MRDETTEVGDVLSARADVDLAWVDLLCAGRLGVDLYGEQQGAPLAEVETFRKYVGGSAANVCVGAARLGLRTAMCSRVGDEGFGRFALDTLRREGVDVSLVQVDAERPTGIVALALRKSDDFPRLFVYRDSADMSLDPVAIDLALVARARAVLVTGSYLVSEQLRRATRLVCDTVRAAGGKVLLDLDYRPVLWGEAPMSRGNDMVASSSRVTDVYRSILPLCDLVVGTDDEVKVAGGDGSVIDSLRAIRALTAATLVVKRGARGATVVTEEIPDDLAAGVSFPGYDVVVENNVGAGDAFLSGFLSRWLRRESLESCLRSANASGAIVVSRHGCMPAMPFAEEHERFVARGGVSRPDDDDEIAWLHRVGARRPSPERLVVLDLSGHADGFGAAGRDTGVLDVLAHALADELAVMSDELRAGRDVAAIGVVTSWSALAEMLLGRGLWLFRPVVKGADLRTWPADVAAATRSDQPDLADVALSCRRAGREMLVELVPGVEVADAARRLYEEHVAPEWWVVPASASSSASTGLANVIQAHDPSCRGLLVKRWPGELDPDHRVTVGFSIDSENRGVVVTSSVEGPPLVAWLEKCLRSGGSRDRSIALATVGDVAREALRDAVRDATSVGPAAHVGTSWVDDEAAQRGRKEDGSANTTYDVYS